MGPQHTQTAGFSLLWIFCHLRSWGWATGRALDYLLIREKEFLFYNIMFNLNVSFVLYSRFSRVQLCATPKTVAHQAPPPLYLWKYSIRYDKLLIWSCSESVCSCPGSHFRYILNMQDCVCSCVFCCLRAHENRQCSILSKLPFLVN